MTEEQRKALTERFKGRKTPVNHPDSDLIAENDMVELSTESIISGLEKIEPLSGIIIESRWSPPSPSEFTVKLNEVIEQQNRIIDYLNQVRK